MYRCADRFPADKMRAFVDRLHSAGQHWVPIHDAAISKQAGYKAYEEGTRAGVWVKDMHGETYVGQVCPTHGINSVLAASSVAWPCMWPLVGIRCMPGRVLHQKTHTVQQAGVSECVLRRYNRCCSNLFRAS